MAPGEGGVSMASVGAAHGAAWRRRKPRLRSMGRLTALSVKVALATSFHHSAGPVPLELDDAREVAQPVDVLESKFVADLDAFKVDFVARLSVLVESVSDVRETQQWVSLCSVFCGLTRFFS